MESDERQGRTEDGRQTGRRLRTRWVFVGLVLMFGGSVFLGGIAALETWLWGGPTWRRQVLVDSESEKSVALVRIAGIIGAPARSGGVTEEEMRRVLDALSEQEWVVGVVLSIDSPGGGAMESDRIAKVVQRFREKTGHPVVALMEGVAASGGYYVAAPCDWIVADEMTLTGSIGVIWSSLNIRGLLDRIGVTPVVFKSGEHKDMLNPWKDPATVDDAERSMVQELVLETFSKFVSVVEEGRARSHATFEELGARELVADWRDYADGRVFSGKKAFELGFVDELGDRSVAFERVKSMLGQSELDFVAIERRIPPGEWFQLTATRLARRPSLLGGVSYENLGLPLAPGKLYFLQSTYLD